MKLFITTCLSIAFAVFGGILLTGCSQPVGGSPASVTIVNQPDSFVFSDGLTNVTVTGMHSRYDGLPALDVRIPDQTPDGRVVTAIRGRYATGTPPNQVSHPSAFENRNIVNLIIPDSINTIGQSAFVDNMLTTLVIPHGVTSIVAAFANNQLTSVEIPSTLTMISGFANNQLTSITIPGSITTIGTSAFANNQLTSVTIPNSVTTIGAWAFMGNQLTSVTIPNSVTSIGAYAFDGNLLTSVTIPPSVTSLGGWSFRNNQLTSANIPDGIINIPESIFDNNLLTSIHIPASVASIGVNAFLGNQLASIHIPDGVTYIGANAFSSNQLTNVIIPNSVTSIGATAFHGNPLASIFIPSSVITIGSLFVPLQSTIFAQIHERPPYTQWPETSVHHNSLIVLAATPTPQITATFAHANGLVNGVGTFTTTTTNTAVNTLNITSPRPITHITINGHTISAAGRVNERMGNLPAGTTTRYNSARFAITGLGTSTVTLNLDLIGHDLDIQVHTDPPPPSTLAELLNYVAINPPTFAQEADRARFRLAHVNAQRAIHILNRLTAEQIATITTELHNALLNAD